jgi:hypothetical protein
VGSAQVGAGAAPAGAGATPPTLAGVPNLFLTHEGLRGLGAIDPAPDLVTETVRYVPALYGIASLRFDESRAGLNVTERVERLVFPIPQADASWSSARPVELGAQGVATAPPKAGTYGELPAGVTASGAVARLRKELADRLVGSSTRRLWFAAGERLYSRHDEDRAAFEARLARERGGGRDAEVAKLQSKYAAKLAALKRKLDKEEADAVAAGVAYDGRKREELVSGAESVLGVFFGRKASRAVSQASTKRRMTEAAGLKAEREKQEAAAVRTDLDSLSAQLQAEVAAIDARHAGQGSTIQELDVPLEKDDVRVETLAILWIPVAGR